MLWLQDIFKNKEGEYSFWDILNSHLKLSLLLAFEKKNGLQSFFQNVKVNRHDYGNVVFFENVFSWEDNISLDSVCQIINLNLDRERDAGSNVSLELDSLFCIYNLLPEYYKNVFYKLPEGISKIHYVFFDKWLVKILNELVIDEVIILPSTLKSISGGLFYDVPCFHIEAN